MGRGSTYTYDYHYCDGLIWSKLVERVDDFDMVEIHLYPYMFRLTRIPNYENIY